MARYEPFKCVIPHEGKDWGAVRYIGIPDGMQVAKLRVRCDRPARLFLTDGKRFESWECAYDDDACTVIRALCPTAQNISTQ